MKLNTREGEVILRRATGEDACPFIIYMNKIASETNYLTFGEGEYKAEVENQKKMIISSLESENQLFLLAINKGEIVGHLIFRGGTRARTRHSGEIGMAVISEFWGLGIGSELIRYLFRWIKQNEIIRKVNLRVRADNTLAIKLYRQMGFQIEGIIEKDLYIEILISTVILWADVSTFNTLSLRRGTPLPFNKY
ncbi:GNAT family N-acetyltransferase [Planococcus lenghuensis]|uniref:GNAT family N-acetyltransferase n=1 Tax=Planococcus lenghuensis TaxID=2213202 RepID=UPI000984B12F|nr:GNAT family N-acetyltransferase [Planococcus lenghuensis]